MMIPRKWLVRGLAKLSRKRDVFLQITEEVSLSGTSWDGGSRSSYELVTSAGQHRSWPSDGYHPPVGFPQFTPGRYVMRPGDIVVSGGTFRGKPAALTFYVHPASLALLFPEFRGDTPPGVVLDWMADRGVDVGSALSRLGASK